MTRGAYRSIHTVLIDGPDYQALPPNAKLVFLTLKLGLGPTGIDVLYSAVLEAQTGLSGDQVSLALDTLEHANWIRRERNVVWIVEGLRYEPSRSLANENHAKEIREHLNSLPRLAIVDAFREHYGLTRHTIPVPVTDAMPDAIGDRIPNHGKGKRDKGQGNTDNSKSVDAAPTAEKPAKPRKAVPPPSPAALAVADVWTARVGAVSAAKVEKLLGNAIVRHGESAVSRAVAAYGEDAAMRRKAVKLEWFAEQVALWVERTGPIVDPKTGLLNERGMALVGEAK